MSNLVFEALCSLVLGLSTEWVALSRQSCVPRQYYRYHGAPLQLTQTSRELFVLDDDLDYIRLLGPSKSYGLQYPRRKTVVRRLVLYSKQYDGIVASVQLEQKLSAGAVSRMPYSAPISLDAFIPYFLS